MTSLNKLIAITAISAIITGCGTSRIISTPIESIDSIPLKFSKLTDKQLENWGHLDLITDTIPGISLNKAYAEIIKNKKGKTTIVAVIDSAIDIDHEDLNDVIWVNEDEIPNNNIDDDNNGYIDDVHGWNFLGDTYDEQLEYVRILASGNTTDPQYSAAIFEYQKAVEKYTQLKSQYQAITAQITAADKVVSGYLNKPEYTKEEVYAITTKDQSVIEAASMIKSIYSFGIGSVTETKTAITKDLVSINEQLDIYLNKSFKGRKTGDNPNDITDIPYGNSNVKPYKADESHGTHVAGIIAAERNNNIGMNGIANNVKIMSVRVVPNGDEYDKDVALAIKYAADNGAKVINMSFGKYYSPHSEWVRDAIIYANKKDVLLVNAAGNEGINIDDKGNFPSDEYQGNEITDAFITVGAINPQYGSLLVADYSNYGKTTVDVFAPGSDIYSTYPNNTYESIDGTSMAAPYVTGLAALIRSQYPKLTAVQVKSVLMNSGIAIKTKVVVGENGTQNDYFNTFSKSGKIINAYNALIMASQL